MAIQLAPGIRSEANPYPTGIGSASEFDLQSLVETIRHQHNFAQAGDTTFPWQDLNDLSQVARYHAGAKGRFFHPDYGLIYARYVKFSATPALDSGVPAGWLKAPLSGFRWEATREITDSDANLVVGLAAASTVPAAGDYGWIIEEGINNQSVIYSGAVTPPLGTKLSWTGSGIVGVSANRQLGVLMSTTGITNVSGSLWQIPPASILVGWR